MSLAPGPSGRGASDSPLSVGFVSPGWPPEAHANGVVTGVATLADEFRRQGHRALVLSPEVPEGPPAPDVYAYRRPADRVGLALRQLDRLMYRARPEAWYSRRNAGDLAAMVSRLVDERGVLLIEMEEAYGFASLVRPRVAVPIVVRLHGPWFLNGPLQGANDDARFRRRVRAERDAIRAADGITAPSRSVLERTRAFYNLPLADAEVIPNLAPGVPESSRWRRAEADPSLILFVGRFDVHKGGDLMIDAFARVARRDPRARLCFVGPDRGLVDARGDRTSLAEYAERRMPGALRSGRVAWLGQQGPSTIAGLRRAAGVTVCCSRYETYGFTLVEAMAFGCPVVATRVGAVPELVEDGSSGLICRPDEPDDLAEKIDRLRDDPGLAERLGRRAALDCETRGDPAALARRMADFYRRLIDGRRPGGHPRGDR